MIPARRTNHRSIRSLSSVADYDDHARPLLAQRSIEGNPDRPGDRQKVTTRFPLLNQLRRRCRRRCTIRSVIQRLSRHAFHRLQLEEFNLLCRRHRQRHKDPMRTQSLALQCLKHHDISRCKPFRPIRWGLRAASLRFAATAFSCAPTRKPKLACCRGKHIVWRRHIVFPCPGHLFLLRVAAAVSPAHLSTRASARAIHTRIWLGGLLDDPARWQRNTNRARKQRSSTQQRYASPQLRRSRS